MKKLSKYYSAFLFASLLLTIGCVKDNGNYVYTELPTMEVTSTVVTANGTPVSVLENNTIYFNKNNEVVISPVYDFDQSINAKYSWTLFVGKQPAYPTPPIPGEVIGEEAVLTYTFEQKPGSYRLVLEARNDQEGMEIKKIVVYNVVIESINGIAVLYNRDGNKGDFGVFKTSEIDENIPSDGIVNRLDIFADVNDGATLNNPRVLNLDYHLTDKYNFCVDGGVALCDVEFVQSSVAYESLFAKNITVPAPFNPQFMISRDASGGTKFAFMVTGDKLYARSAPVFSLGTNLFGKFNDDDYFPYVVLAAGEKSSTGHVIFNKTGKKFQYLGSGFGFDDFGDGNVKKPQDIVSSGEVLISDTKMEALAYERSGTTLVAIMKDEASKIFLVRFDYPKDVDGKYTAACLSKLDLSTFAGVTDKTVWEFGSHGDYAFYATGNEMHVLNTVKNSVSDANLGLPADETITKITLLRNESNEKYNGSLLFVSTLKNGNVGTVYQFVISRLSGRPDVMSKKVVTGFGEIRDIKVIKQQ